MLEDRLLRFDLIRSKVRRLRVSRSGGVVRGATSRPC